MGRRSVQRPLGGGGTGDGIGVHGRDETDRGWERDHGGSTETPVGCGVTEVRRKDVEAYEPFLSSSLLQLTSNLYT